MSGSREILRPTSANYTAFVHVLHVRPETAEAPLKVQRDDLPCGAAEPTWHWQPGEYTIDQHRLTVPSAPPSGEYLPGVDLYDANMVQRTPLTGEALHMHRGEAIVGSITVISP